MGKHSNKKFQLIFVFLFRLQLDSLEEKKT